MQQNWKKHIKISIMVLHVTVYNIGEPSRLIV